MDKGITSGDYLADVKIVIESARNEPVLAATMEGRFSWP